MYIFFHIFPFANFCDFHELFLGLSLPSTMNFSIFVVAFANFLVVFAIQRFFANMVLFSFMLSINFWNIFCTFQSHFYYFSYFQSNLFFRFFAYHLTKTAKEIAKFSVNLRSCVKTN